MGAREERFWAKVQRRGYAECWPWSAGRDRDGYGIFWNGRRGVRAHRYAYECEVGPIPEGLVIDHLCDNPPCCNPRHMSPTTNRANILRGTSPSANNARKSVCAHGHDLTPQNTYYPPGGGRHCRECHRERNRAHMRKRRWQFRFAGALAGVKA